MTTTTQSAQRRALDLMQKQFRSMIKLPVPDLAGVSAENIATMLRDLTRLALVVDDIGSWPPFVTRDDDPVSYPTPAGLVLAEILQWINATNVHAYATLEAMQPDSYQEKCERFVALIDFYAGRDDAEKLYALVDQYRAFHRAK